MAARVWPSEPVGTIVANVRLLLCWTENAPLVCNTACSALTAMIVSFAGSYVAYGYAAFRKVPFVNPFRCAMIINTSAVFSFCFTVLDSMLKS